MPPRWRSPARSRPRWRSPMHRPALPRRPSSAELRPPSPGRSPCLAPSAALAPSSPRAWPRAAHGGRSPHLPRGTSMPASPHESLATSFASPLQDAPPVLRHESRGWSSPRAPDRAFRAHRRPGGTCRSRSGSRRPARRCARAPCGRRFRRCRRGGTSRSPSPDRRYPAPGRRGAAPRSESRRCPASSETASPPRAACPREAHIHPATPRSFPGRPRRCPSAPARSDRTDGPARPSRQGSPRSS